MNFVIKRNPYKPVLPNYCSIKRKGQCAPLTMDTFTCVKNFYNNSTNIYL